MASQPLCGPLCPLHALHELPHGFSHPCGNSCSRRQLPTSSGCFLLWSLDQDLVDYGLRQI